MRQGKVTEQLLPQVLCCSGCSDVGWSSLRLGLKSDLVSLRKGSNLLPHLGSYTAPAGMKWQRFAGSGGAAGIAGQQKAHKLVTRVEWKPHKETGYVFCRKATEMTWNLFQTFLSREKELDMNAKLSQIQTSDLMAKDLIWPLFQRSDLINLNTIPEWRLPLLAPGAALSFSSRSCRRIPVGNDTAPASFCCLTSSLSLFLSSLLTSALRVPKHYHCSLELWCDLLPLSFFPSSSRQNCALQEVTQDIF